MIFGAPVPISRFLTFTVFMAEIPFFDLALNSYFNFNMKQLIFLQENVHDYYSFTSSVIFL